MREYCVTSRIVLYLLRRHDTGHRNGGAAVITISGGDHESPEES